MAFAGAKIIQPFALHDSDPFNKAKLSTITSSSPFLGSTRNLRLLQSAPTAQPRPASASRVVAAVSDVFKEKKLKTGSDLVRLCFLLLFLLTCFPNFLFPFLFGDGS